MKRKLLIVDDNERIFESLEINFRQAGYECLWADNGDKAIRLTREERPVAAIVDFSLGNEDGIEVMRRMFEVLPGLPAIVITGFGTFAAAVRATKLGAYDFLAKPLNFDRLNEVLREALMMHDASEGGPVPDSAMSTEVAMRSPAMQSVWDTAARVADTDIPVLITGESGTGKELVAERIHRCSSRRNSPFVRVNCSAITGSLAESELFGHRKGAFTGAASDRPGLIREADRGTLHLDEIGDMSPDIQAKLLRVLEDKRVRPLGGEKEVEVDVRIVASTNKDIESMIGRNEFRSDLYYRFNAVELKIPPLRERSEDIIPLLELFLARCAEGRPPKRFSDKAVRRLHEYCWPGNVRELRNTVKVSCAIVPGDIIEVDDLPATIRHELPGTGSVRIIDAERELIIRALKDCGGNRQATSSRLGISRRTLYNKMKNYGLEP